jgi:hypothetical protein
MFVPTKADERGAKVKYQRRQQILESGCQSRADNRARVPPPVQPQQAATVCELDLVQHAIRSWKRAQTLDPD